jgi:homoserine O-acetyltransferase
MDTSIALAATEHSPSVTFAEGMTLDCGTRLSRVTVAYRTYGTLNAARSNAVLVCHALTGDQYVAETHPVTGKEGWWDIVVGPGRPLDTERYFVICANVLGGCMGSTGPRSLRDDQVGPWGTDFPPVTIQDMVRAQKMLIDQLGIPRLFAVMGGSMGAMQALQWAASYPDAVFAALPIAGAAYHSAQNIAFHEVGRQAIFADPDWQGGRGLHLRAAVRRELLSDDHPRDGLLRPGGRLSGRCGERVPRHEDAVPARVVHLGLALPDSRKPHDRACAEPRWGERVVRGNPHRQGA